MIAVHTKFYQGPQIDLNPHTGYPRFKLTHIYLPGWSTPSPEQNPIKICDKN